MTYAQRLRDLCPFHKRKTKGERKGFACICVELDQAFSYGLKAVRRRRSGRDL